MKKIVCTLAALVLLVGGCGSQNNDRDRGFFTSGNRDADQRAEQRVAKAEQINPQQNKTTADKGDGKDGAVQAPNKQTLYGRLGGEEGIEKIVDDFIPRAMNDPRVNWNRKGMTRGGWTFSRGESIAWNPSPADIDQMKKHFAQFLAVATGGPAHYDGQEIKHAHQGMHIANAEFDAAVGDLKATLDKLAIATPEQKELLAILESTRPQIVEQR